MTVADVRARLRGIRAIVHDDEAAHSDEDALYVHVLEAIASGQAEDPAALAAEALKAGKIKFARWCA